MRVRLLTAFSVLFFVSSAYAQQGVKRYVAPLSGKVVLKDVHDKYAAIVYSVEMPDPDASAEQEKLQQIKERVSELYPRRTMVKSGVGYRKTTAPPMPILVKGFVPDSVAGIPPDNNMAVGSHDSSISVMNSYLNIQNTVTGKGLAFHKTLASFSSVVGLSGTGDYRYDPKVIYDPVEDKFIVIMLNGTNVSNYIVVGFSATHDPLGAWNFYKFYGNYAGDTTWFDYPSIAITKNELFFTGNKILFDTTWQAGFKKSVIYQVRKSDGYNGDSVLNYQIWDSVKYNGGYVRNLYPVKGGNNIFGPDQYFLSDRNFDVRNDTFFLVKIPDTIGAIGNTLTVTALKSPINYGVPPNGRQDDTSVLATNDGRVLGAFAVDNEIQFVSTTVDSANGASGIFHGVISNYKTSPVITTANIISVDTLDFGYPNLSYTGHSSSGPNESIISFDYTGASRYAGMGAVFFDGSNYSDILDVRSGASYINISGIGHVQRWGDYTGSQPQWDDLGNVWVNGLYGRSFHNYGSYMAKLISPYHTGVQQPEKSQSAKVNVYPNPAEQFIKIDFEVPEKQAVSFFIYDVQGRRVDKVIKTMCEEGRNIIQFNIASLAPGTYYLKAVGDKDAVITTQRFIRQ